MSFILIQLKDIIKSLLNFTQVIQVDLNNRHIIHFSDFKLPFIILIIINKKNYLQNFFIHRGSIINQQYLFF